MDVLVQIIKPKNKIYGITHTLALRNKFKSDIMVRISKKTDY